MDNLEQTPRITLLKEKMLNEPRYVSIEQARIITRIYQENESLSIPKKRALSLKAALEELEIGVEKEELIVGNRTKGVRYGVVFPESGCSWINKEFETLPTRPQDKFRIKKEDVKEFKEIIYPYWQDRSLEDVIKENYGEEINVPMGENVGASPDGRNALTPLADGGMSPVYGRDMAGPTAVLKSVSRMKDSYTTNGGLLNMKFLPEFFKTETGMMKFENFLRAFVDLKIPHIQFNVVRREDLLDAKLHPEQHRSLTIRVAGYTAYFVELAGKLQDEIIERTAYEDI